MVAKLPPTMLFFALRLTVPVPPLAEREPRKLMPAPDDLRITLPVLAEIEEPALELKAPLASASKLPVAVELEPLKFMAPALLRKTPLEALAFTLVAAISRREPELLPMAPPPLALKVRFCAVTVALPVMLPAVEVIVVISVAEPTGPFTVTELPVICVLLPAVTMAATLAAPPTLMVNEFVPIVSVLAKAL